MYFECGLIYNEPYCEAMEYIMHHLEMVPWIARFSCTFVFLAIFVWGGGSVLYGYPEAVNASEKLLSSLIYLLFIAMVCAVATM